MYSVAVKRDFVAQHFLIGGEWGHENKRHSHHYRVELRLEGPTLNEHGYLVDILEVESNLQALVEHYRDQTLNEVPEFSGLNPSIEHFARIMCAELSARIGAANVSTFTVRLWENEIAWSSYRLERTAR